jgi:hypothetical protein
MDRSGPQPLNSCILLRPMRPFLRRNCDHTPLYSDIMNKYYRVSPQDALIRSLTHTTRGASGRPFTKQPLVDKLKSANQIIETKSVILLEHCRVESPGVVCFVQTMESAVGMERLKSLSCFQVLRRCTPSLHLRSIQSNTLIDFTEPAVYSRFLH